VSDPVSFAKTLAERCDTETLARVMACLLARPVEPFPRMLSYRPKDFRRALGNMSTYTWNVLRRAKKIPDGMRIAPQIEIWTEQQVIETTVALAAEQHARIEQQRATADRLRSPPPEPALGPPPSQPPRRAARSRS
jgi:hypothetical protein